MRYKLNVLKNTFRIEMWSRKKKKKEKIETKNKFFEIKSNLFIKSCEGER